MDAAREHEGGRDAPGEPSESGTFEVDDAGGPGPVEGSERDCAAEPISDAEDLRDHQWIRRAQVGEEAAFAALVERHGARAFRVARNLVPSDEDARDLAQEAFLRVFRHLERFDFKHTFRTWLHRIVTNLAIDHLRRRRVPVRGTGNADGDDPAPEIDVVDARVEAPSQRLEADETAARVRECIASLAPHFQTVLVLRELEGMSCAEIARIVSATEVTVRWRLHRGRKLFQEEWERRERLAEAGLDGRGLPRRTNSDEHPS